MKRISTLEHKRRTNAWIEQASCTDQVQLFSQTFEPSCPPEVLQQAISTCFSCPVMGACLETALASEGRGRPEGNRFGIFGGLTPHQRFEAYKVWVKQHNPSAPQLAEDGLRICQTCKRTMRPQKATKAQFPDTICPATLISCVTCQKRKRRHQNREGILS